MAIGFPPSTLAVEFFHSETRACSCTCRAPHRYCDPQDLHTGIHTATIRFFTLPLKKIPWSRFSGTFWNFCHSAACNGRILWTLPSRLSYEANKKLIGEARKAPENRSGYRAQRLCKYVGLLATASASALALFLGSALSSCGVSCMIWEIYPKRNDGSTLTLLVLRRWRCFLALRSALVVWVLSRQAWSVVRE